MHPKMKLKNKLYLTLSLIVVISLLVLNSMFDVVNCNIKRDYKGARDKYFQEVKDKILKLEKEEIKDPVTIKRLAEQYNLIGIFYLEKHLWDMSIDAFTNSIKYGNASADAYYSLGLGYGNRGADKNSQDDFNKAEFYYRKALEINGSLLDAKYALSILLFYHREKGKEEAQTLINEIIIKNPAYYPARFANGKINYELGNKEKALTIYQDLASDLEKLPPSGISNEYKIQCSSNITRIMSELSMSR